jgi:hypothetical protein
LKSVNVSKTVNCANYEFGGERWIAGSDLRVSGFPSVTWDINAPSLQSHLQTTGSAKVTDCQDAGGAFAVFSSWRRSKQLRERLSGECK